MPKQESFNLVLPARNIYELEQAKKMFSEFVSGNFSYDAITKRPEYISYASAQTLAVILPLMVEEHLKRKDRENYLIYPMIAAIEPNRRDALYAARTNELVKLVDKSTAEKILKFLYELQKDPPIPIEELDTIVKFWQESKIT